MNTVPRKRPAEPRTPVTNEAERLLLLCADWLWESDPQHRIAWLSSGFADHAGLAPSAVLGRTRLTSLHPSVASGEGRLADDIAGHRAFKGFLHDLRDRDGRERTVCLTGLPRFDADGVFLGYRGTGRVVPAAVVAERQGLPASMELVGQLAVPVFARDAAQRFLYANAAFAEIVDTRPDLIVGRRTSDIMAPRQALRLENAENAVLMTGMPCSMVLTFRDGPARIAHLARIERQDGSYAIAGHLEAVARRTDVPELPASLEGARVLVVHHEEAHRRNLSGQMSGARFDACAASSAAEALGVLRVTAEMGRPADCILLDEHMPRADLAEIIRVSPQLARTPVILLAANDGPERVLATVQATIRRHKLAN